MGPFDIAAAYARLDSIQKQAVDKKRVQADLFVDDWISMLRGVDEFDRRSNEAGEQARMLAGLSVLAGVAGLVVGAVTHLLWLGALLPIGAAAAAPPALIAWRARRRNLPQNPRRFALAVMETLRPLVAHGAPVHLEADLQLGMRRELQVAEKQTGSAPMQVLLGERTDRTGSTAPVAREIFYEHPFMEGRARLADGSALGWVVVENIEFTEEYDYREGGTRSNRYRTFTNKVRVETVIEVSLHRPGAPIVAEVQAGNNEVGDRYRIEPGPDGTTVKVQRRTCTFNLEPVPPEDFAAALAEARKRAGLG